MRIGEAGVDSAIERFQSAGLTGTGWEAALESLVELTGSMGGQLIGLGSNAAVPFNLTVGIDPASTGEFVAAGGGDPKINSRVRVGSIVPELRILDESAFTTSEDVRLFPEYGEWIRRYDVAFGCLTPLVKADPLLVGIAMMRNTRQGNIGREQRKAFARVAQHARMAVRTQMILQHQSVALVTDILDALPATVFLCDAFGRVLAMSAMAEQLLSAGTHLKLLSGRLSAIAAPDQPGLNVMVARAIDPSAAPPDRPVVVRNAEGDDPLLIEVAPVPRKHPLGFGIALVTIVRRPSDDPGRFADAAQVLFGLTPAEANVSAQLALGRTVSAIAQSHGVSVGTVRTHVRRIFDKAGTSNQLELASLLSRFS